MPELSQQELWRHRCRPGGFARYKLSSSVSLSAVSLANSVQTYLPSESYMSP